MKLSITLWLFTVSVGYTQTLRDYFNNFPFKPLDITIDSLSEHFWIDVDEKNAFVSVHYTSEDYGDDYGGNFQFTYFVKADKSKVFALKHFFSGPSSNSREINFYTHKGEWANVTEKVIPKISLADFNPESPYIDSVGTDYEINVELPRIGTDLTLTVEAIELYDIPFNQEYPRYIASFPELILKWNREKGIFEKKQSSSVSK